MIRWYRTRLRIYPLTCLLPQHQHQHLTRCRRLCRRQRLTQRHRHRLHPTRRQNHQYLSHQYLSRQYLKLRRRHLFQAPDPLALG